MNNKKRGKTNKRPEFACPLLRRSKKGERFGNSNASPVGIESMWRKLYVNIPVYFTSHVYDIFNNCTHTLQDKYGMVCVALADTVPAHLCDLHEHSRLLGSMFECIFPFLQAITYSRKVYSLLFTWASPQANYKVAWMFKGLWKNSNVWRNASNSQIVCFSFFFFFCVNCWSKPHDIILKELCWLYTMKFSNNDMLCLKTRLRKRKACHQLKNTTHHSRWSQWTMTIACQTSRIPHPPLQMEKSMLYLVQQRPLSSLAALRVRWAWTSRWTSISTILKDLS